MNWLRQSTGFLIVVLLSSLADAQTVGRDDVRVGRYSSVPAEPTQEQSNPLAATISIHFPKRRVKTVGEAIHYILQKSGFRLASAHASDPAMNVLLTRPLPEVQRHLGPCPLDHALTTLAGPVYRLVVDPLHRLISFEVTKQYQALAYSRYPVRAAKTVAITHLSPMHRASRFSLSVGIKSAWVYGPVQPQDTMLPIALRFRQNPSATPEQMMLAVWQTNQSAFGTTGGIPNMNFLRLGATLHAPPHGTWQHWTPADALREVRRHRVLWATYVQQTHRGTHFEFL